MRGSGLPLGGTGLSAEAYADFVAKEYLGDYVRGGGSAVRFIVLGSDDVTLRWRGALAAAASAEGYLHVTADAATVRVHLVDQLYAAVARRVDWRELAQRQVRAVWKEIGLPPVAADGLAVAAVAAYNEVDPREAERDAVLAWLRVEPVALRVLRSASLHTRIGRHNARSILVSLAAWRAAIAGTGLVLDVDLARLAVARRPPVEQRAGVYYSKAAVLDVYEVLRQLVDATDTLRSVFVAITLPPDLVADDARGLPAYSALHLRIIDEVRDRRRANPFAALVRLETRMEATP
jgi:hypothetical protein